MKSHIAFCSAAGLIWTDPWAPIYARLPEVVGWLRWLVWEVPHKHTPKRSSVQGIKG